MGDGPDSSIMVELHKLQSCNMVALLGGPKIPKRSFISILVASKDLRVNLSLISKVYITLGHKRVICLN